MQPTDITHFNRIIGPLFEYFDKSATPAVVKIYFAGLMRYDLSQIETAIGQLIETSQFMPKVADFITALEGRTEDRAESAWSFFTEAVRRGGQMKSLYSSDAILVSAIKRTFGSWIKACELLPGTDDPMFASMKKTFLASYQIALREGCTDHYLTGRAEVENASNGGLQAMLLAGKETYQQDVICLVNGRVSLKSSAFSTATGRLVDAQILALPGMQPDENEQRALLNSQTMKLISDKTM